MEIDWSRFLDAHRTSIAGSGIPEWYFAGMPRFQTLLADGYSGLDWSDWDITDADPGVATELVEGYLEAGGINPALRFLGAHRRAIARAHPMWSLGHPDWSRVPRGSPGFRAHVRRGRDAWIRMRDQIPGLPKPWLGMRREGFLSFLVTGTWHEGGIVDAWGGLPAEDRRAVLSLVDRAIEDNLVPTWVGFLPYDDRVRLRRAFPRGLVEDHPRPWSSPPRADRWANQSPLTGSPNCIVGRSRASLSPKAGVLRSAEIRSPATGF